MRVFPIIAATGLLAGTGFALDDSALPAWQGKERAELEASGWVPGALLLTGEPVPGEPPGPAGGEPQLDPPKPEEIAADPAPFVALPEKFLPAYFAERPKSFLVDPQGLLSPADYRDRLALLNYHAGDSSIDLFVCVLDGNQEIPSAVREEEMTERFFSTGRPAALIFYYLGAPQRAEIFLSPSLTGPIPAAEQRRALESSVMQAVEQTNPAEQFGKFLVQMSIRAYWMERMIAGESPAVAASLPAASAAADKPVRVGAKSAKFLLFQALALQAAVPVSVLLGALAFTFGLGRLIRLRARYRFPEFEVEPRLGGAHAAGIGAVISFASAAVPPASQRDQVPDYLRRA